MCVHARVYVCRERACMYVIWSRVSLSTASVKVRRRFIRILSTTMKHNHIQDNSAGKTNISVDGWHSHPIYISYTLADNLHLAVHP